MLTATSFHALSIRNFICYFVRPTRPGADIISAQHKQPERPQYGSSVAAGSQELAGNSALPGRRCTVGRQLRIRVYIFELYELL